jgi:hypothetical protein
MPSFSDMSSDRIMACRVFDGEIRKIEDMIERGDHDSEFLQTVADYLSYRIQDMETKRHGTVEDIK